MKIKLNFNISEIKINKEAMEKLNKRLEVSKGVIYEKTCKALAKRRELEKIINELEEKKE
jgi:hypothetical protein